MKQTATRKRPTKASANDSASMVIEFSDMNAGRIVWSDGSVTSYKPESLIGRKLTAQLRKARNAPTKRVAVSTRTLKRKWGWFNGRWTVIGLE